MIPSEIRSEPEKYTELVSVSGYGKRYREDCPLPEDAFLNSLFILNKN